MFDSLDLDPLPPTQLPTVCAEERCGNALTFSRRDTWSWIISTEESFGPYEQTGKEEEESGMAGTRRALVCGHSPESGL